MGRNDWRPVNPRSSHAKKHAPPRSDKPDKGGSEKNFDRSVEEIFTKYSQDKGS